ncbi:hypothetical protein V8E54_000231 [Elaphomyces granulatus]
MPQGPPVDPDEPQHLDAAVLWRIKLLKYEDQNGPPAAAIPGLVPDEDIRNINAVLSAYRPRESLWDKIWEEQQAWTKVYGDSQPWVEDHLRSNCGQLTRNIQYAVHANRLKFDSFTD